MSSPPAKFVARFGAFLAFLTLIISSLIIISAASSWNDISGFNAAAAQALKLKATRLDPVKPLLFAILISTAIGLFGGAHFLLQLCHSIGRGRPLLMPSHRPARWFALTTAWMLLPLAAIGVLIGWLVPTLFGNPPLAHHLAGGLLFSGCVAGFIATQRKLRSPFGQRTRSKPHPSP